MLFLVQCINMQIHYYFKSTYFFCDAGKISGNDISKSLKYIEFYSLTKH